MFFEIKVRFGAVLQGTYLLQIRHLFIRQFIRYLYAACIVALLYI